MILRPVLGGPNPSVPPLPLVPSVVRNATTSARRCDALHLSAGAVHQHLTSYIASPSTRYNFCQPLPSCFLRSLS
ncbi:family transcriptional regulator, putative [Babesia ovata]|uniref:Family transcriptional regulator, putative n=1 Tax=Babesia ovata TaxID=189622 RepID=A0A2H6K6A5_9APIC|nr:family transcriptional regulator, putative [Babesia ovata]GBE58518.1 family transcriptional regulator, putative [Babesia ovata]